MKLLVTGGAGFIGSNFVRQWLSEHPADTITNLDLLTYAGKRENLADVEAQFSDRYEFIHGDICDREIVEKAMQGVDVVVHFAAETHVDRSVSGPAAFVNTNVNGTQVLLDAARAAKIKRFHHVSTDEVFGSLPMDPSVKFSEETPYDPRSPYSASKAASDHLVRAYFHTYDLPITISNCTNNYGPYQYPEKLIPVMILKALRNESLPIYGDGMNVRDWIHVDDHNHGVAAIIEKGKVGGTYCLGGDAEMANLDIAKLILKELGKPEDLLTFVQDRPGHDRRYAMHTEKAKRELGWSQKHTFESGLRQTIEWYVANAENLTLDEQGSHTK